MWRGIRRRRVGRRRSRSGAVVNLQEPRLDGGGRRSGRGASREPIDTTRAIVEALAKMNVRPSVLVSASATGIYGSRGDELLTKEARQGRIFGGACAGVGSGSVEAEALGFAWCWRGLELY